MKIEEKIFKKHCNSSPKRKFLRHAQRFFSPPYKPYKERNASKIKEKLIEKKFLSKNISKYFPPNFFQ